MSILLLGRTTCPICKQVIKEGDKFYLFPAFVLNTRDPFYFFNDDAFHEACLEKAKSGLEAKKLAELFKEKVKPANRRSIVSGKLISSPDRHIFIEFLTSKESYWLFQFNFTHIDKSDLFQWEKRVRLIEELIRLKESGEWQEKQGSEYLGKLILRLEGNDSK